MRWTPRGWLWNVSGLEAVELHMTNGTNFLVGTNEPHRLLEALAERRRAMRRARALRWL
jgi:hypothetical protein